MTRNNVPGLVSEEVGDAGFFSWGSRTILIQIMGKTQHWILEKDETVSNLVAVGFGKGEPKSPFWLVQARIHIKPDGGPVDCRLHWVQWRWLRRRPHPAADYWGTAASIATDRFDGRHGNEVESSVALALSRSISNQVFDLRNRTVLNGVFLTPVVKSFVGAQMTVPKMRWLLDEVTVSKMGKAGQSAEKTALHPRSFLKAFELELTRRSYLIFAVGGERSQFGQSFPLHRQQQWRQRKCNRKRNTNL